MNLNDRISKVIEYSGLTSSEFADKVDVQRSSISHITSGRNKPSLDFLMKVKEHFPQLQWEWLINGDGEMIITENPLLQDEESVPERRTSYSDLFALIEDEDFGKSDSPTVVPSNFNEISQKVSPLDSSKPPYDQGRDNLNDSQRLEPENPISVPQTSNNQGSNIKRIVIFYENGKFESFEP